MKQRHLPALLRVGLAALCAALLAIGTTGLYNPAEPAKEPPIATLTHSLQTGMPDIARIFQRLTDERSMSPVAARLVDQQQVYAVVYEVFSRIFGADRDDPAETYVPPPHRRTGNQTLRPTAWQTTCMRDPLDPHSGEMASASEST
ncbi:hypothetical protein [Paraburkholderia sp.]|uniref:hypothetical protein n=1 Tax=Paraburkholderia sp. TaxID=1926495 RepID=UPI0023A51BFE|nr:hypothetical protein [Paraburkholderia sp.]MDE1184248.1 hypothetical protein [Paraburkholderia sp.]